MGLFSSSTKYLAHAGSSELFEEDSRKDTVKSLMLQASIDRSASLADAVQMGLQTNLYARARSMLRYAAKPDGYTLGFPETDQDVLIVPSDAVQVAIEAEIGEPIQGLTVNSGNQSSGDLLVQALQSVYMDPAYFPWAGDPLNTTYNPSASSVEIPVADPTHDPLAEPPTSPYYYAENTPDYYEIVEPGDFGDGEWAPPVGTGQYRVTFSYTDSAGDPQTWTVASLITPGSSNSNLIQASYSRVSTPDITEYWSYTLGSGDNPTFESAVSSTGIYMEYLPIVMLMHDTKWFDELGDANLEKTTDRILRRLALDPYEVKETYIEQVTESIENGDRPGEKKLDDWDFFIQFAVPIHSRIRGSREYLYEYFKSIEHTMPNRDAYDAFLTSGGSQPYGEIHITEYGEQGYNAYYRYSYIESKEVIGEYTPPGWTDPLRHNRAHSKVYEFGSADYAEGLEIFHGAGTPVALAEGKQESHDYLLVTRQKTINGVQRYYQILVMGPSMKYVVNTRDEVGGDGTYRDRDVEIELFPEDPEEESEFKIPVHAASLKALPAMHREEMLQDALHATVYLVEKQKVKWYQKSFFKWLIVIIVIIVIIVFQQYELLGEVAKLAGTALATGATGTAIAFAALYVAMTFALGFLISFAGNLIGGDFGQLFILLASIYLAGGMDFFSNLGNQWGSLVSSPGWGTASAFLQTVRPILDAGMTVYQRYELDKLEDEMKDFTSSAKEKQEQLEDAYDQLGDTPNWLDPMDLVRTFSEAVLAESPQQFYARTTNANPGVMGYDFVSNFTDMALMLPEKGANNFVDIMFEQLAEQRGQI